MKRNIRKLSIQNLKRKPMRTTALVLLTALLSLSVFGGSILILSLRRGLASYEERLGADIVVVPYEARSHGTFESILLQGIPGYFYMKGSVLDAVAAREGVEAVSPQFFLASASAGCCSVAVQIIGFDPATDFSIQPWIAESYTGEIGDYDLVVGSNINIPADRTLTFYHTPCRVVAQLSETGTGLDTAVYTNMNTIRAMMEASHKAGFDYYDGDASHAISSVMVKVEEGYDIGAVCDDINIHIRKVKAGQSQNMVSDIASGLRATARMIGFLTALVWLLAVVILLIATVMIVNERRKELSMLRVMGASGQMVGRILRTEAALTGLVGAVLGVGISALVLLPFHNLIKEALGLPYLLPRPGMVLLLMLGALLVAVLTGVGASGAVSRRITAKEAGLMLREDA